MSEVVTRRSLVTAGVATAAGVAGLGGAAYLADQYGLIPPDHQGIVGFGETLTYATQRLLTSDHSLAREFKRSDISTNPSGPAASGNVADNLWNAHPRNKLGNGLRLKGGI